MRVTSVKEFEQKVISGGEPDFRKGHTSIVSALNWYSYYMDYKDSKKYLLHHMQINGYDKDVIESVTKLNDSVFSNVGFVCRMKERGAQLKEKDLEWIEAKIEKFKLISSQIVEDVTDDIKPKSNIQDYISEQSSVMIGELEGLLDDYKKPFNAYEWMIANGVKSVHAKRISIHFIKQCVEPQEVLSGEADEQLIEGYSNYTKSDLKKYLGFMQEIISDSNKIINNSKISKKPRKKKTKPADRFINKLQYKKEDIEYKVVSINPVDIIGAKQLWIFNTKIRKLGFYNSDEGLSVKGTTIVNCSSSFQKTLRQPGDVLSVLMKATEKKYKTIYQEIKAVEQNLTNRINSDIILLKVFK